MTVSLKRHQRRALVRELRELAEDRGDLAGNIADEFADRMMRREDLGLQDADPMAVSDYAYGLAKWVDSNRL